MERIGPAALAVSHGSRLGLRPSDEPAPIIRAEQLPALVVPNTFHTVMFWENGTPDTGTAVLRRPHSPAEREALQQRILDLRSATMPMETVGRQARDELLRAVAGMLNGFPMQQRYDEQTALAIAAGYLWIVRSQPPWAIIRGAEMVRSGKAGLNLAFCPSEPEFNTVVAQCVEPYAVALQRTERLLLARVEHPKDTPAAPRRALPSYADGKHAARASANLEAEKRRREAEGGTEPPEAA